MLTMTAEDYYEAYGDAGMDEDDLATWKLACERDAADEAKAEEYYCPIAAAEARAGC